MWGPANGVLSLIMALIGIVAVLAFTYYASRWYAGRVGSSISGGKQIKVLDRVALGKNGALALVELAGVQYLISMSEHGAQILKELDEPVIIPEVNAAIFDFSGLNFKSIMEKVRLRKG
ncbi:MAG: flagellar biosynthetic protein FliO [Oscillospiraceae bacterium]|nr:flagellar biosynthetic protein FliO [Oscillospiraceae bacterium]